MINEFVPKVSVLMSVYYKERPNNLWQSLESLANQTLPADEIVVVKDGILPVELDDTLLLWQDKLPLKIIGYEKNKGLAYALNYGLDYCSNDLIARMDSDDICLPDRLKKQIMFLEKNQNIALLSGYISEFNNVPNDILSIRKVPIGYKKIVKYLKIRSPFNHMAVLFKKSAVLFVGGYREIGRFEDYDLWIRLIRAGYKVDNISDVLVYVRIGNNMIMRRSGFKYAQEEFLFLKQQMKNSFITPIEFIFLLILRVPVRLCPLRILSIIYYNILR
jgi:glycosyltransferase involved in cell wall biosynthesis